MSGLASAANGTFRHGCRRLKRIRTTETTPRPAALANAANKAFNLRMNCGDYIWIWQLSLHRRMDDTRADHADTRFFVGNRGIDQRQHAAIDHFAHIHAGGNAHEIERRNGDIGVFAGGDFAHGLAVAHGIRHRTADQGHYRRGGRHRKSADAIGFGDGRIKGLCMLEFPERKALETELRALHKALQARFVRRATARSQALQHELDLYFAGKLQAFATPLQPVGTPFQQTVWRELQTIAYGATRSYKEQAARIGKPQAMRAVAAANGQNKISILIPCHRVIGSDGSLTGYGGGLERKRALLDLESGQAALAVG